MKIARAAHKLNHIALYVTIIVLIGNHAEGKADCNFMLTVIAHDCITFGTLRQVRNVALWWHIT